MSFHLQDCMDLDSSGSLDALWTSAGRQSISVFIFFRLQTTRPNYIFLHSDKYFAVQVCKISEWEGLEIGYRRGDSFLKCLDSVPLLDVCELQVQIV